MPFATNKVMVTRLAQDVKMILPNKHNLAGQFPDIDEETERIMLEEHVPSKLFPFFEKD